jgi:hypothetical protein
MREEGQTLGLAKGEVVLSETLNLSGQVAVTIESDLGIIVSNDEIIPKDQRDLGKVFDSFAGHQDTPTLPRVDLKRKGVAIPDDAVNTDDDESDDESDDDSDADPMLAKAIAASRGTTSGSSSHFMSDKGRTSSYRRMDDPSHNKNLLIEHEWNSAWYLPTDSIYFGNATQHAYNAVSCINNTDLKAHLKATTILAKGLKEEIAGIKAEQSKNTATVLPPPSLYATASQVRIQGKTI